MVKSGRVEKVAVMPDEHYTPSFGLAVPLLKRKSNKSGGRSRGVRSKQKAAGFRLIYNIMREWTLEVELRKIEVAHLYMSHDKKIPLEFVVAEAS